MSATADAVAARQVWSNELIGVLGVGVALAALMLVGWTDMRLEFRALRAELGGEMSELRLETGTETRELRRAIGRLDDRVRRVEIRLGVVEVEAHETEATPGGDESPAGAGGTNHDTPPVSEPGDRAEV